jgi:hypothetical protein
MSDYIKELAEKATHRVSGEEGLGGCHWEDEVDLKEFAELVVNECIWAIRDLRLRTEMGGGVPPGYDEASHMLGTSEAISEIKERFGIN